MPYDDFRSRQSQVDAALDFISSGRVAYNPLPISGSNTTGCLDSSQCGSGYACRRGICEKEEPGGNTLGSGNTSGCGGGSSDNGAPNNCTSGTTQKVRQFVSEDIADFYKGLLKKIKKGELKEDIIGLTINNNTGLATVTKNGKCLKTGCGFFTSNGEPDACCGKGRCCRIGQGLVQCFCGDCPDPPNNCSKFCTSYLAVNGENAPGCNNENTCDECSNCIDEGPFVGTNCEPKTGNGPCWCGAPTGVECGQCEACLENGTCFPDADNCAPGPFDEDEPEDEDPDKCQGNCKTITVCDDEPPPCPPRTTCRQSGSIQVGERNCILIEQCDKSGVPEDCGECDCNCEDDCGSCKICDESTGTCVPDPECPDCGKTADGRSRIICPGKANANGDECCEPDESCYTQNIYQSSPFRSCCAGRVVTVYENDVQVSSSGTIFTYYSVGGPIVGGVIAACDNPSGKARDCGGSLQPCTDPGSRPWYAVYNSLEGPACGSFVCKACANDGRGALRLRSYSDGQCIPLGSGGVPTENFPPVVKESRIYRSYCCTLLPPLP